METSKQNFKMSDYPFMKMKRDLGQLLSIDHRPEKAANHYFKTKNNVLKPKIKEDAGRLTPITDLIAANRQLDEAVSELMETRLSMADWDLVNIKKWEEIREKELQLRDNVQHFNDFVAENHEKRERAKEKIKNESEIQSRLEQEIHEVSSKVEYLGKIENDLNAKVAEYQIYKDFLVKVAENDQSLTDTQQVLNRYETLSATRSLLSNQQAAALNNVQTTRETLASKAEEQAGNMMGLHTQLAQLRVNLENAQKRRHKWETALSHVQRFAAEKAEEIERVRSSCWEMYKTLCKLRKEPVTLSIGDTEEQLVYITRRNKELLQVADIIRAKMEKGDPLTNGNVVTSSLK